MKLWNWWNKKSTHDDSKAAVLFPVLYETHDLATFQAEAHWVPAVRERDADGNLTTKPREWKGNRVHALTLLAPDGTPHRVKDRAGRPESTHRALADSREEAELVFGDQIRNSFWSQVRSLEIVEFQADQARRVKDERDRMAAWMVEHHPQEFARVLGIAESAVEEYKRSLADPSLKAKVDQMLGGANG